ncbi:MAG: hypothetical protein FJ011_24405 [Chloroflexi bacterium]|nr:hypothetical protein [Chloroflexota bacterium]
MHDRSVLFCVLLLIVAGALSGCSSGPADVEPPAADAPTAVAPLPAATAMIADLGFRPEVHGFNFENYSAEPNVQSLTAVEVRRLFGDQVCATLSGGRCVLTPPGQQWLEQINGDMAGGHCEGMAVLSLLMYTDHVTETLFGGRNAIDLAFDNPALQREIAYWWATQATAPTLDRVIKAAPNDILARLKEMAPGRETYTLGVYKPDGSDGHAITPFALAAEADGRMAILVYDNNYPKEVRRVVVDTQANTWSYEAAVNPQAQSELYEGNADTQTLDLTPTSARLTRQTCPFCAGAASGRASRGLAAPALRYNQVFLDGDGQLLLRDDGGRRLGYVAGRWVNEIPGAKIVGLKTATPLTDDPEPTYWLPQGVNVTITLDGRRLARESASDLVLIGPGYSFGVEGISLAPGQVDTVRFAPAAGMVTYETAQPESPNIVIGIEQPVADYYFELQGADLRDGGSITVALDVLAGALVVNAGKLTNAGAFNLALSRYDDERVQEFYTDELALPAGAQLRIHYAAWGGQGSGLVIEVDTNGDGVADEEYTASDKN